MTLPLLVLTTLALAASLAWTAARRRDLGRLRAGLEERRAARQRGTHQARLQYPFVDLTRCIGCATCVRACPEEGVLDVLHGQAQVVHGARCVGHGRCAEACPVGAIALTLGDIRDRDDLPALNERQEAVGTPGVYLAGEVTGYALVRTAIQHGVAVAREVHRLREEQGPPPEGTLDLVIVGAGPAGIACALEARRLGLDFLVLEQEALGGTVSKYPRRKLVLTQPVDLPLYGRLERLSYTKEELLELWRTIVERHELPIRYGQRLQGVVAGTRGRHRVVTSDGEVEAAAVCLALGRRGSPRKLGVPGEELPKVTYSLLDARSYQGRRLLVVGGGDSAVEAAMGLAEQEGNEVTLSYRKEAFFRLKSRNEARLQRMQEAGLLRVVVQSRVRTIREDEVELEVGPPEEARVETLANDEVFVMIGGEPPFELLKRCGVSFDPSLRPESDPAVEQGTGLLRALGLAFLLSCGALIWVLLHRDYYLAERSLRALHPLYERLRPARALGLAFGIGGAACVLLNLSYLLRRSRWFPLEFGSLRSWMTLHLATGVSALLLGVVHGGLDWRLSVGGQTLLAMGFLVLTGAIGRYLYAFIPRSANGRELELDEVHGELARLSSEWDRTNREFGERVRRAIGELVDSTRWNRGILARIAGLFGQQRALDRLLVELRREGVREGIPEDQLRQILALARRSHRASLMAARFEDLRTLLGSWRYFHRWVALLMVLILILHVYTALRYGGVATEGLGR